MRYRFTSSLPCCTAGSGVIYLEYAREHCRFARTEESANLMSEAPSLRSAVLAAQLAEARDTAGVLIQAAQPPGADVKVVRPRLRLRALHLDPAALASARPHL